MRIFFEKKIGVKKSKFANRPKRVLPKFRGDQSHVRGVNGRLKFARTAVYGYMSRGFNWGNKKMNSGEIVSRGPAPEATG